MDLVKVIFICLGNIFRSPTIYNRDITESDYIMAMDTDNFSTLQQLAPNKMNTKLY